MSLNLTALGLQPRPKRFARVVIFVLRGNLANGSTCPVRLILPREARLRSFPISRLGTNKASSSLQNNIPKQSLGTSDENAL